MSRTRTTSLGFVAKFAGISVNGTTVSSADSAGTAQSGMPNAAKPAAARPPLSTSRRVVTLTSGLREFRHDELEDLQWRRAALRDARRLSGTEIQPVSFAHLMILAVEGDRPLAFHQVQQLIRLRVTGRVVLFAAAQPPQCT